VTVTGQGDIKNPGQKEARVSAITQPKRKAPPHLPAVLMLGVVSQVAQVLFLRELLMVFHGNELSIGIILAAWMLWVGAGSRLGVALSIRSKNPASLLSFSTAGILLLLPATIWVIRGLRGFFAVLPGAYLSLVEIALSSFLVMAPGCLLFGILFVLLSRVWREYSGTDDTSAAGKTYLVEAAGNMLGGVIFTFLLVHYLDSFQTAVIAGLLLLAAALSAPGGIAASATFRTMPRLLFGALLLAAILAFPFLDQLNQRAYQMQWELFTPLHQLVDIRQSKHGTIAVLQHQDQYTFFQSGHLLFSTAGPLAPAPGFEKQQAVHFAHLAMAQHPAPRRILLIGGGLRGSLSEIIRYPVEQVDYIELDPVLTEMAGPYLSAATLAALADPRVRLLHTDGRLFVKTTEKQYDLIIVDLPDPVTAVLNRYYTREFFQEAAALLNPGGVFVIAATSTPDLRGLAVTNRNTAIYHTLAGVFSQVVVAGEQLMFFFAGDTPGQISVDATVLAERFRKQNIKSDAFAPEHFYTLLPEMQLRRVNWVVRHHGRSSEAHLAGPDIGPISFPPVAALDQAEEILPPVAQRHFINTDFRPISYYYTLMFWDELTRANRGEIFRRLLRVQPSWILPLLLIPLLGVIALRATASRCGRRFDRGFAVLFAVFATGLSTMSLQIAMLFSFQSIYGFVFEMVGLITAVFMGGLALGTYLTNRFLPDKGSLNLLAGAQALIALLAVIIALVLPQAAAVQSLTAVLAIFYILTFIAGLAGGVCFPLSAANFLAVKKHTEKTTGAVYGVELFGACAGAVLAGALVAPVLGIVACCLFGAIVNIAAFVVILIAKT